MLPCFYLFTCDFCLIDGGARAPFHITVKAFNVTKEQQQQKKGELAKILRSSVCGDAGWEQVTSWWGGRPQLCPSLQLVFIDFSPNLQATSTELIFGP